MLCFVCEMIAIVGNDGIRIHNFLFILHTHGHDIDQFTFTKALMNLHSKYLMFFYDSSLHLNAKE